MSNNTVLNLNLSATQIANIEAALTTLESELASLVSLTAEQKRRRLKMGDRSESFSRHALRVISESPQTIPASVPVSAAIAGLSTLDQLRPVRVRLSRLCERAQDTDAALGSSIMGVALQSYGLLKIAGRNEGLRGMRDQLSANFSKGKRSKPSEEPKAA